MMGFFGGFGGVFIKELPLVTNTTLNDSQLFCSLQEKAEPSS